MGTGGVVFLEVLDWKGMCSQGFESWQQSTASGRTGYCEILMVPHSGAGGCQWSRAPSFLNKAF